MSVNYTKTASTISVVINFSPKVIPSSHPNFDKIAKLLADPKTTEAQLEPLLDIPKAIVEFTGGDVTVINGKLFYKGFEAKTSLSRMIMKMINDGDTRAAEALKQFMVNAHSNPDPRAASDLYDWVAASGLPITDDGHILAWKAVQKDYYSIHSGVRGKLFHGLGTVVEEPRHETDSNPDRTCSRGLHFCSAPYLKSYAGGGSRVIAVKINPRDVVAFPRDYGWQKGRACRYEVVGEVPMEKVAEFYPQGSVVYSGFTTPVVPVPAPKSLNGFTVGDSWLQRDGAKVVIEDITVDAEYPIITRKLGSKDTQRLTAKGGRFFANPFWTSAFDLSRKLK